MQAGDRPQNFRPVKQRKGKAGPGGAKPSARPGAREIQPAGVAETTSAAGPLDSMQFTFAAFASLSSDGLESIVVCRYPHTPPIAMKQATFLAVLFFLAVGPLAAAVLPYANDFSGTGANTAFTTETTNAEWSVTGGVYQYTYTNTTLTPSRASLQVTNASGAAFTMQTQFTVTSIGSVNSNGETLGFGLFGSDATFAGSGVSTAYYLADFQYANSGTPGSLRILALGDTSGTTSNAVSVDANPSTANLAVVLNTTYTLRLAGSYTGSTLNMTLGLFDAAGTTQIGTSATATDTTVLTGTNFGFRNRAGIGGGTVSVAFDNFSITTAAIPEPRSAAIFGCATLLAALGWRRCAGGRPRQRGSAL